MHHDGESVRRPMKSTLILLAASSLGSAAACQSETPVAVATKPQAAQYVWWEGESAPRTNMRRNHSFAPANEREAAVLSDGAWLGNDGPQAETIFAEYDIEVPESGKYNLYIRKFWEHGPFRWRFDNQPWRESRRVTLLDEAPIRLHVVANWVGAGVVELEKGRHVFRVELLERDGAAAFDAFVLTPSLFDPRGKLKPDERFNVRVDGWFGFEPGIDPFQDSPIDLRFLNEKQAGDGGFIQARGDRFVHEKTGREIRFWGTNCGPGLLALDDASLAYMARYFAKKGINIVRYHGAVNDSDLRPDQETIRLVHRFVTAMKKEGIYTCLSIYFPLWVRLSNDQGFGQYDNKHPFSLLYFNDRFQERYREWWKALLTSKNPETGLSLVEDPAVAIVELVNEDSYFFWTFTPYENIPPEQMAILEAQLGNWARSKYGSVQNAMATWNNQGARGDDLAAGRLGFLPLWEIFNQKTPRGKDTAEFLARSQQKFYSDSYRFIKSDLKYKGTVYASNWITADARILGPLDKYSNTVADVMDRHGYFGGRHTGERAGYSISPGDRYDDRSALLFQNENGEGANYDLPIWDIIYNGKPSIITEVNWPLPNRYRADFAPIAAAYGALQGSNGFFFFASSGPTWQNLHSKFGLQTPAVFGQFPATALMYRTGMVRRGETVVEANLNLKDLFNLKGSMVQAPQNLDELRAADIPPGATATATSAETMDPLAFLVGRVEVNFSDESKPSKFVNLANRINRNQKIVRSSTDELSWNWGIGLATFNAPKAQGATGFLGRAGAIELKDITIRSPLHYGTILVVALDDQPIAESNKLLVQAFSEDKNHQWEAPGEGLREIRSLGSAPIIVKSIEGTIRMKTAGNASLKVTRLDANGYAVGTSAVTAEVVLDAATMYYLIERA